MEILIQEKWLVGTRHNSHNALLTSEQKANQYIENLAITARDIGKSEKRGIRYKLVKSTYIVKPVNVMVLR